MKADTGARSVEYGIILMAIAALLLFGVGLLIHAAVAMGA